MKFNFSKEWCLQAAQTEAGIAVAACNPNIFKENQMKTKSNVELLEEFYINVTGLNNSWQGYSNISPEEWIKKIENTKEQILERMK